MHKQKIKNIKVSNVMEYDVALYCQESHDLQTSYRFIIDADIFNFCRKLTLNTYSLVIPME